MASSFGPLLRGLRQSTGLTIEELSHASGVSVRAIGDMERGVSRGPQRRTVEALADALGLDDEQRAELADTARAGRPRAADPAPEQPGSNALPRSLGDFVGRTAELELLDERARTASADGPTPVVVVHGAAGLGKTACAVRAAELLHERFPDGGLYVDLRGVDPEPMATTEALRRLLLASGLDARAIAEDQHERAGQLRAILADRRSLVLLDNAADEAQVRPLLPAHGAGMVIVTSRRTLAGLEGVTRVPLAPFSPQESAELLEALANRTADGNAVTETAAETARVSELCGRLPLALRIAGTRLASQPEWTMRHLAERLSDEDRRLANLAVGDVGVEAAFALSYVALPEQAKECFRRLALVPAVDFGAPIAAVLTETDRYDAEDQLDELVELGLLQHEGTDRYRFHDLIRLYANQRLHEEESDAARATAERRMTDWLLETATAAGRWFDGESPPAGDEGHVRFTSPEEARVWLLVEKESWLAALRLAAVAGRDAQVARFGEAMNWIANETQVWATDWLEVFGLTRSAAARLPDRRGELWHTIRYVWARLTVAAQRRDDKALREAAEQAMEAYQLAEGLGAVREQAEAVCNAAEAWRLAHDDDRSLWAYTRGRELAETAGDQSTYFWASGGLVVGLAQAGRYDDALKAFRSMLRTIEELPAPTAAAENTRWFALARLSTLLADAGRYGDVVEIARTSAAALLEEGNNWAPLTHRAVGRAYLGLGANDKAREHLTLAIGRGEARGRWQPRPAFVDEVNALIAALDDEAGAPEEIG
ncbi:XRE family transcriptional regulator [Promicromonospora sp. MEB111]|uniref:ATP-binding protein n=1 Tax=Promicromonospora sp. MEB111 TaxID=3040301 RepID=UPI00254B5601|nr:XRE family transcriptional regulator [Promicromonospora sp. MEB111]